MQFKKIYIEITNSCNFACSFCFPSSRKKRFMPVEEFREIVCKIKPFTNYIYLHVLGEPLLHPHLDEILTIAEENNLFVNITTNGSLISQKKDILKKHNIRLVNISLHDIEENIPPEKLDSYFEEVLSFTKEISEKTYICLRLWNKEKEETTTFNSLCLSKIKEKLNLYFEVPTAQTKGNGFKLLPNIFLQNERRFQWQTTPKSPKGDFGVCYALKDHIAILADGSVVPCCIDADANLLLGNIHDTELADILNSEKAIRIKKGFLNGKAVENYCKTCGFIA
jgi:radical SAM protein with 4Fe4S-binding SPASM domain